MEDSFLAEAEEEMPEVGLTPLIDVVFQLLVFFMLTSSMATSSLELNLPHATTGESEPPRDALMVEIDAEGQVALAGEQLEGSLPEALRRLQSGPDGFGQAETAPVLLRADQSTPYAAVAAIMQSLGHAGFTQIHFIYEETEAP